MSELTELDRAVAEAIGYKEGDQWVILPRERILFSQFHPSTDGQLAMDLQREHGFTVGPHVVENGIITSWKCGKTWPMDTQMFLCGPTPEISICRAIVNKGEK